MLKKIVVGASLVLLAVVLVRTAWVTDDAFTSFRVVDNLLAGHGLRWNVVERVQVYTHPLWLLLLVPGSAVAGPYATALALGIGLTLGASAWLAGVARGWEQTLVVGVATVTSMAFVDFATSGLENPLAHALMLAVAHRLSLGPEGWRQRAVVVALAALVGVDRLDHLVLVAPAVLATVVRRPWGEGALAASVGALPLVAWEVFAVVYYGFPLPNTAYAKVFTDLPVVGMAKHGLAYLENTARWDPVLTVVASLGLLGALVRRRRAEVAVAAGMVLWVGYLVKVGGDHMSGRFVTPLFALGLWLVLRTGPTGSGALVVAAVLALLGPFERNPPLASGADLRERDLDDAHIIDERSHLYRQAGLLRVLLHGPVDSLGGAAEGTAARALGPHTVLRPMIGWFSHYAGPEVHVVDPLGLGDPLLAHLPARVGPHRTGHYFRDVPRGYVEAAAAGGRLPDPDLDAYWADVRSVTRDPLFAARRWEAILRLNTRLDDPRARAWCERACSRFREADARPLADARALPGHGIGVDLAPARPVRRVEVTAEPGSYVVRVLRQGRTLHERALRVPEQDGAFGVGSVLVPPGWADQVRVLPVDAHPLLRSVRVHAPE